MPAIDLAVFTKPWFDPIEVLADKMAGLGVQGVELPIRPGYQVTPDNVTNSLAGARKVLESRGLAIRSVAAPLDDAIIAACGDNGVPLVRSMVGIDLAKAGYARTIAQARARYDELIPLLDRSGVAIGVQNHSGNCIGSAIGLYHLMEAYDRKHVCAILDMAHCGIAGEPTELSVDLLWDRMPNLVNFKNAYRERINGPEEAEAVYRTHWTTGPHGAYSWSGLVRELDRRGFTGTFCLPAEYTDPNGQPQRMGDDVLQFLTADIAYLRGLIGARKAA
ncbi:MAG TPA: TIM barrel protein [Devosiaceae bacterium]|jgi:sugar phosphate isomerase/epimerase